MKALSLRQLQSSAGPHKRKIAYTALFTGVAILLLFAFVPATRILSIPSALNSQPAVNLGTNYNFYSTTYNSHVFWSQTLYADSVSYFQDHVNFTNALLGSGTVAWSFGAGVQGNNITISQIASNLIELDDAVASPSMTYVFFYYLNPLPVTQVNSISSSGFLQNYSAFLSCAAPCVYQNQGQGYLEISNPAGSASQNLVYLTPQTISSSSSSSSATTSTIKTSTSTTSATTTSPTTPSTSTTSTTTTTKTTTLSTTTTTSITSTSLTSSLSSTTITSTSSSSTSSTSSSANSTIVSSITQSSTGSSSSTSSKVSSQSVNNSATNSQSNTIPSHPTTTIFGASSSIGDAVIAYMAVLVTGSPFVVWLAGKRNDSGSRSMPWRW